MFEKKTALSTSDVGVSAKLSHISRSWEGSYGNGGYISTLMVGERGAKAIGGSGAVREDDGQAVDATIINSTLEAIKNKGAGRSNDVEAIIWLFSLLYHLLRAKKVHGNLRDVKSVMNK